MKIETMAIVITGIIAIAFLEGLAMANGMNGVGLAGAVGAIGAIIGGTFTYLITKGKNQKDTKNG